MNAAKPTIRSPRLVARGLRKLRLLVAIAMLCPALANAEQIENTASVTYVRADTGELVSRLSNTVVTQVLPLPAPGEIEFRRYDPGLPGGSGV